MFPLSFTEGKVRLRTGNEASLSVKRCPRKAFLPGAYWQFGLDFWSVEGSLVAGVQNKGFVKQNSFGSVIKNSKH